MRIVVEAANSGAARLVQDRLTAAGIEAAASMSNGARDAVIRIFGNDQGDVLTGAPPLARLLVATDAMSPPSAIGFDGAIAIDAPPTLLRRQIDFWTRLGVATEERARRAATAEAFGLKHPSEAPDRALKALYIGAPNAAFLALERAIQDQGGHVAGAFSSFSGLDHLHDEGFDAVVLNGADSKQLALSVCSALRRNTALFEMPTLVVVARGDTATAREAIDRGACAVLEAYAASDTTVAWLLEAVRNERRRRSTERALHGLRDIMSELHSGLWRSTEFHAHLARLAIDHQANGRPLALAALRVLPAHGARRPNEAVWKRGFAEVASIAARLCRPADSATAFPDDVIILALPASSFAAARRVADRTTAVASCTAFVAGDQSAAPLVLEQSIVELHPGESGQAALGRLLRGIDLEHLTGAA
ncbi:MAG: hypothetical protein JNM59_14490 [Hyphomonadaceae bacterium]|nr:hypothetical protein [Hyphomonadaceae bacterium]